MASVPRRSARLFLSHISQGRSRSAVLWATTALAVALFGPAGHAAATIRPAATASWRVVPTPSLVPDNALSAAAVVSKQLAWAVGTEGYASDGSKPGTPLMLRWNGTRWSRARLPGSWQGGLAAVAASSATNAWALGTNASAMLIAHLLHWNGHGWRSTAVPNFGGSINADINLAAAPGGRAWISTDNGGKSSVLFSWNGASWRPQSYPCPHWGCGLIKITARTGKDAWAVGNYVTSAGSGGPLALHWTGSSWITTSVPFVRDGYLTGVSGISSTDAWAVGAVFGSAAMLLYHWDGTAWHKIQTPAGLTQPPLGENTGITGDSSGHLWIYDFGMPGGDQATYLRYNGQRWAMVRDAPVTGEIEAIVRVVAAVPGTQTVWSVGVGLIPGPDGRARIERYG